MLLRRAHSLAAALGASPNSRGGSLLLPLPLPRGRTLGSFLLRWLPPQAAGPGGRGFLREPPSPALVSVEATLLPGASSPKVAFVTVPTVLPHQTVSSMAARGPCSSPHPTPHSTPRVLKNHLPSRPTNGQVNGCLVEVPRG